MVPNDFETNPISFTFDPNAGIMMGTTFVKVVCRDDSCRVVDLFGHMAKVDAKPEGELLAAAERDPILSKAKINQVAIKQKSISPTMWTSTYHRTSRPLTSSRAQHALTLPCQNQQVSLEDSDKAVILRSHLGRLIGEKIQNTPCTSG